MFDILYDLPTEVMIYNITTYSEALVLAKGLIEILFMFF